MPAASPITHTEQGAASEASSCKGKTPLKQPHTAAAPRPPSSAQASDLPLIQFRHCAAGVRGPCSGQMRCQTPVGLIYPRSGGFCIPWKTAWLLLPPGGQTSHVGLPLGWGHPFSNRREEQFRGCLEAAFISHLQISPQPQQGGTWAATHTEIQPYQSSSSYAVCLLLARTVRQHRTQSHSISTLPSACHRLVNSSALFPAQWQWPSTPHSLPANMLSGHQGFFQPRHPLQLFHSAHETAALSMGRVCPSTQEEASPHR